MILNITHNDLDGIASAAVVREAFGKYNVMTKYVNYFTINNLDELLINYNLEELELVVLTDINIKEDKVIRFMNRHPDKFLLIDHHMDTAKLQSKFKFENYVNMEFCGAVNTYRYLEVENENLKEFVRLANIFDLHKIDSPRYTEAERFSDVCNLVDNDTVINSIEMLNLSEFKNKFSAFEYLLDLEYENHKNSLKLIKDYGDVKLWNFENGNNLITPNISNRIYDITEESGIANVIIYNFEPDGKKFKCSCRSDINGIDFPRIISACGFKGGGHAKAAGLTLFEKEDIKILLKNIKDFIKNI